MIIILQGLLFSHDAFFEFPVESLIATIKKRRMGSRISFPIRLPSKFFTRCICLRENKSSCGREFPLFEWKQDLLFSSAKCHYQPSVARTNVIVFAGGKRWCFNYVIFLSSRDSIGGGRRTRSLRSDDEDKSLATSLYRKTAALMRHRLNFVPRLSVIFLIVILLVQWTIITKKITTSFNFWKQTERLRVNMGIMCTFWVFL